MKYAVFDGQLTRASAGDPTTATCPNCGGVVELRSRQGTWFWRHVRRPRGGCQLQQAPEATDCMAEDNQGEVTI